MDLMVFSREPKPEVLEDIQKTHGSPIRHRLHILHNICPLVSLLLADSSLLLYNQLPIAIENVLILVGILFSNKTPIIHRQWVHTIVVVFPFLGKLVMSDILI